MKRGARFSIGNLKYGHSFLTWKTFFFCITNIKKSRSCKQNIMHIKDLLMESFLKPESLSILHSPTLKRR